MRQRVMLKTDENYYMQDRIGEVFDGDDFVGYSLW